MKNYRLCIAHRVCYYGLCWINLDQSPWRSSCRIRSDSQTTGLIIDEDGDAGPALNQHQFNVFLFSMLDRSKQDTLSQCWYNVGSATDNQHWFYIYCDELWVMPPPPPRFPYIRRPCHTPPPPPLPLIWRLRRLTSCTRMHQGCHPYITQWMNRCVSHINPYSTKSDNLNFHRLEVVSRYRDPQLQVGENYSYLFKLRPNICKFWCLNRFIPCNSDLIKRIKTTIVVISRQKVNIGGDYRRLNSLFLFSFIWSWNC